MQILARGAWRWATILVAGAVAAAAQAPPSLVAEGETFGDAAALLANVSGHSPIFAIAWSADGSTLAAGSSEGGVTIWDTRSGAEIKRLRDYRSHVDSIAFAHDGRRLALASREGYISIWDLETDSEKSRLEVDSRATAIAFSRDGKTVATGLENGSACLWTVGADFEPECFMGHSSEVSSVAINPGGTAVAAGAWDRIILWSLSRGGKLHRLEGRFGRVRALAFDPSGNLLATGSSDGLVRLWDLATGLEEESFAGHTGPVSTLTFSSEGSTLASGSLDNSVRLWDLPTGTEARLLEGHSGQIQMVAFSPGDKFLASGSSDGAVRLWAASSGELVRTLENHARKVDSLALSRDGEILVTGSSGAGIRVWGRSETLQVAYTDEIDFFSVTGSLVTAAAISQAKKRLAIGFHDGSIRIWPLARMGSGPPGKLERPKGQGAHTGPILALAFSLDGGTLASGSGDGSVGVWDWGNLQETQRIEGRASAVLALAFNSDGKTLASGSRDRIVRLWDPVSGREIRRFEGLQNTILGVGFSPDGGLVAALQDSALFSWNLSNGTGRVTQRIPIDISTASFSSDGQALATAGPRGGGIVHLWSWGVTNNYELSRMLLGGKRGTWAVCSIGQQCMRNDDGTLLVRSDAHGEMVPVVPAADQASSKLDLLSAPQEPLVVPDGKSTSFVLRLRNEGAGRSFWINVRRTAVAAADPLVFYPPPTVLRVEPGMEIKLPCRVSVHTAYGDPRGREFPLNLEVTSAHGTPLAIPVTVRNQTPELEWGEARWQRNSSQLSVSLSNIGDQPLSSARFILGLADLAATAITYPEPIQPKEKVTLQFDAEGFDPSRKTRVDVTVQALAPPNHRWVFRQQEVVLPLSKWVLYLLPTVLSLLALVSLGRLRLYSHPLVVRLSKQPEKLKSLAPAQLHHARQLLYRARRLDGVLAAADVQSAWLDTAVEFAVETNPGRRCELLASRLGIRSKDVLGEDSRLWLLKLADEFPLNLQECVVFLPSSAQSPTDVLNTLHSRSDTLDRVTLIVSRDNSTQAKLSKLTDPSSLWVALSSAELTALLLSRDPSRKLASAIARHVRLTHISPYQLAGGTNKESIFFGRSELLTHIMHREPANYLLVGGRRVGKSSLLKAIERRYRRDPRICCHYVVLSGIELTRPLALALGLPVESKLEDVLSHLAADHESHHLMLIDEADSFIRDERSRNYRTLQILRSLSEEGRSHFIFAGFWDLYEATKFDYYSPLKNFGETRTIGALEIDACRKLAIQPMRTMSIRFEDEELVERLINETGRRANLISISCNEILKNLDPEDRVIRKDNVEVALRSDAIDRALAGWEFLAGNDQEGSRLDRIIVYSTIRRESFTLADVIFLLEKRNQLPEPERVKRSLARLDLAFVLTRKESRYFYQVPLFRRMVLAQEPETLLEQEICRI